MVFIVLKRSPSVPVFGVLATPLLEAAKEEESMQVRMIKGSGMEANISEEKSARDWCRWAVGWEDIWGCNGWSSRELQRASPLSGNWTVLQTFCEAIIATTETIEKDAE